jgi:ADP-dependent NAD(P)H-hydrate dehydratase / NAD(P)H-hydrate epimerase
MRVLTMEAMRALDTAACAALTDVELMRRAGRSTAAIARTCHLKRRIVGLVGYGNNGGDALAALAELDASYERIALLFDAGDRASDARRDAEQRARSAGVLYRRATPENITSIIASANFFLDGLLGIGARSGMPEEIRAVTRAVNENVKKTVLAIDVPTGLDATTGIPESDAIKAHATIALGALKLGLLLEDARPHVGELWFDDIGMGNSRFDAAASSAYTTLDETSAAALLPKRAANADKRVAGAPLIIAGSEQFPGAAVLCARAAARSGAGYVTVATPMSAATVLRTHFIEQVVIAFDEATPERTIENILGASRRYGSIALGPGLGLSEAIGTIVRGVILGSTLPIVVDAGGLFHLTRHLDILHGKNVVLTPHAGEFTRLSGNEACPSSERLPRLRAFVREHGIVTMLKGQTTLVDDGSRVYLNTTGTQALATAGTGDVLTGIIATLLAQGKTPFEAASLAAYWHGRAGQIAASRQPSGVIAGDVIDALAQALPKHTALTMPTRIF